MSFTKYAEKMVLESVLKGKTFTTLPKVYIGLFTTEITETGAGIEVTAVDTGYVRQQITFGETTESADGFTVVKNDNEFDFGIATEDYGIVTHCGIFDAVSGGNMLIYDEFENPKEILKGDCLKIGLEYIEIGLN